MKIELLAEHIEQFITLIAKIVPLHSPVPILGNILLEATQEGFFLSATNLELGLKIKIPAKITTPGATTIPARQFTDVINSITTGKIEIIQDADSLLLLSQNGKIKFQTIPKDEFPSIFEEKGEKIHIFKKKDFQNIFSHLTYVCSLDESRPSLTGVYIVGRGEATHFVATDGYRLSLQEIQGSLGEEGIIISSRLLQEVLSVKTDSDISMNINKTTNQIIFETPEVIFVGRIIEGPFPNYGKVIPTSSKTHATIDVAEFSRVLRLASVFARENANIVKLSVLDGVLTLFSTASGVGEGEVKLDVEQSGEENEISFNVKYLQDFLKNVDAKRIVMGLNSATEPAIFRIEGNEEFLHIIMPVKVQ